MIGLTYLTIAFIANGIANVLLKVGSDRGVHLDWSLDVVRLVSTHAYLIAGMSFFAVSILFYIAALRSLPLSFAYPIMVGMTFLIVSAGSALILRESIGSLQYLGFALIVAGLVLASVR